MLQVLIIIEVVSLLHKLTLSILLHKLTLSVILDRPRSPKCISRTVMIHYLARSELDLMEDL